MFSGYYQKIDSEESIAGAKLKNLIIWPIAGRAAFIMNSKIYLREISRVLTVKAVL